jgi:hypothetical protein
MTGYMFAFLVGWAIAFLLLSMPQVLRASGGRWAIARGSLRFDPKRLAIPAALALIVVVAANALSGDALQRLSEGPVGAAAAAIVVVVVVFDIVMIRKRSRATGF